jgi:hypothetical protein
MDVITGITHQTFFKELCVVICLQKIKALLNMIFSYCKRHLMLFYLSFKMCLANKLLQNIEVSVQPFHQEIEK